VISHVNVLVSLMENRVFAQLNCDKMSILMMVESISLPLISARSWPSHTASQEIVATTMYSGSQLESATTLYFCGALVSANVTRVRNSHSVVWSRVERFQVRRR
jgi:hypothetical protein